MLVPTDAIIKGFHIYDANRNVSRARGREKSSLKRRCSIDQSSLLGPPTTVFTIVVVAAATKVVRYWEEKSQQTDFREETAHVHILLVPCFLATAHIASMLLKLTGNAPGLSQLEPVPEDDG